MKKHYRALFLSDIHLGYPLCQADALLSLLDEISFDSLYLVGDIIDLWYLKQNQFQLLNPSHTRLFNRLLGYALEGKRVYYLSGNHDDALENPELKQLLEGLGIILDRHASHRTLSGKLYSVHHGDDFDIIDFGQSRVLTRAAGSMLLRAGASIDQIQVRLRGILGLSYWSLTGFAAEKIRFKRLNELGMSSLDFFENAISYDAKKRGFDGIICGHVHIPTSKLLHGVHYLNIGDWVKSCTALVETTEGQLEILKYNPKIRLRK